MKRRGERPGSIEVDAELDFHVERLEAELCAQGMSPSEAAVEARRRFGDPEHWRELCLKQWDEPRWLERGLLGLIVGAVLWMGFTSWSQHRENRRVLDEIRAALAGRTAQAATPAEAPATSSPRETLPSARREESAGTITPRALLDLNRSGRWAEAERAAERLLSSNAGDLVPGDRGSVLLSLAYSRVRIGDESGARRALTELEALTSGLPATHALLVRARSLEQELSTGRPVPTNRRAAAPADDDWPVATPDEVGLTAVSKALIFMPMAISFVGAGVIWNFIYEVKPPDAPQIGLLNALVVALGGQPRAWVAWTTAPWPFQWINNIFLIVIVIWLQTGFAMVLFSAALKGISTEVLEASRVDGATEVQIFMRIMVPIISGTISLWPQRF